MSDMTVTLYQVYGIALVAIFVIVFTIYLEIDERKNQDPVTTSATKDVKHERHAGNKTEYRGNGKAVSGGSPSKRRGWNSWNLVRSGRRSQTGSRPRHTSVHW